MKINEMIEFDKIIEKWEEIAVTEHARCRIRETDCILEEGELRKSLKDTTDSKIFMETCGTPPLASMDEVREILQKAERDECLTPYQLERVEKGLVAYASKYRRQDGFHQDSCLKLYDGTMRTSCDVF